jgi:hypothetical protein
VLNQALNFSYDFYRNDFSKEELEAFRQDAKVYHRRAEKKYNRLARTFSQIKQHMPNLYRIDVGHGVPLPAELLLALTNTLIGHLTMLQCHMGPRSIMPHTLHSWPLHSLNLQIGFGNFDHSDLGLDYKLSKSLITLSANTLQDLRWNQVYSFRDFVPDDTGSTHICQFPNLRMLEMSAITYPDNPMMRSLQSASRLRTLRITCSKQQHVLAERSLKGWLALRELEYLELEESLNTINTILSNATHLQKLRYKTYKSDLSFGQSMKRQILPVLVDSFYQLTSLSLVFPGTIISIQALQAISQIRTLQQVHISSGNQAGWRQTWPVDHRAIIKSFRRFARSETTGHVWRYLRST